MNGCIYIPYMELVLCWHSAAIVAHMSVDLAVLGGVDTESHLALDVTSAACSCCVIIA